MALRIILVGIGGVGKSWVQRTFSQNQDVELVAYVDINTQTLSSAQQELNIAADRCFTTLEAALDAIECDAILNATILAAHVPVTLTALNASKHVLLEKPFAPTLAEAQHIVEVAAKQQRVLMVSQNYRYHPAVRAVTRLVHEGILGPVGTVNVDFRRYANTLPRESNPYYQVWQPLLIDMAIHHFDLMRLVLGQEPHEIICRTWNPPWSNFVEDAAASATIIFDGGTVVNYRGSWVSPSPRTCWGGEWRMECMHGEIAWTARNHEGADYVSIQALEQEAKFIELLETPLVDRSGTLHAFVEAIRTGEEPECSGRNNLKTLAFAFAMVEAATSGMPIRL